MKITRNVNTEVFAGTVVYDIPTYEVRIKLNKDLALRTDEEGYLATESNPKPKSRIDDLYDYSEKVAGVASKYVTELNLKCKIEGEDVQITTIEELLCFEDGIQLVGEFGNTILGGVKLGNVSKKT